MGKRRRGKERRWREFATVESSSMVETTPLHPSYLVYLAASEALHGVRTDSMDGVFGMSCGERLGLLNDRYKRRSIKKRMLHVRPGPRMHVYTARVYI